MDHLLATFFSLVFAHGAAVHTINAVNDQPVALPTFSARYEAPVMLPERHTPPVAVNRHAGYAVASAVRSHI